MPRIARLASLVAAVALLTVAFPGAAASAPTPPLDHAGRWITDADGRVVILHGWNMVNKVGSYRPEDAGFGDDDARFLADNGFNTVRLGVVHKGLEPDPAGPGGRPRYREDYLASIARTEATLARRGIYTLLDFHQDLYNERFQGEGLPDWAVVGDAATLPAEPKQGFPANYLVMPALNRAFDHFWANDPAADGRRLQDAYAAAWRHVAGRFRGRARVLGYNLFNEPWPGSQFPSCISASGCPVFDQQFLTPFSKKTIDEIRKGDPEKLAWYSPLLTFDFGADTSHGDTGDPNAGFAFNMYCLADGGAGIALGVPTTVPCDVGYDLTLDNAEQQSRETGDALLMTEFGATDDVAKIERVLELADERMISWQQWHYCDCDDPTTAAQPPSRQAVVKDPRQPPAGANVDSAKLRVSSRPYPQAVSGTPEAFDFDSDTRRFDLRYSTSRAGGGGRFPAGAESEVFVPPVHYGQGYRAVASGARVVSRPGARVLRLRACPGASRVTVVVTPGVGRVSGCAAGTRSRLSVSVRPRVVRAGTRRRFSFRVVAGGSVVRRARVRFAGRSALTGRRGRATTVVRLSRAGRYRVTATRSGFGRGTATVRARRGVSLTG